MKVAGSIALVTGANRGLGLAFANALVDMGAAKFYAAARNPEAVTLKGVVPLKLDVTSDEDVVAAARVAGNLNLLVNNAGIARPGGFLADEAIEAAREQFEVNFVAPLRMARAFAPVLAKNGGGAIINVLSVASWMNGPALATYGASKSAAWALTNGLRIELAQQGTQVVALHAGFIDTDLARKYVFSSNVSAVSGKDWAILFRSNHPDSWPSLCNFMVILSSKTRRLYLALPRRN